MKLLILNGPNLNLLGTREPQIYGDTSLRDLETVLKSKYREHQLVWKQSNHEGELIDILQNAKEEFDGVVMNPAAYGHTSIALADCLAAIDIRVIEVHISQVFSREEMRRNLLCAPFVEAFISGFGVNGYEIAIKHFLDE